MDYWGLFHGVNKISGVLLRCVSLYFEYDIFFYWCSALDMLLLLAWNSAFSRHSYRYADLWPTSDCVSSVCRIHIPWELKFMTQFFKLSWWYTCLCWDHAWSLAFENITLSSWLSPTQDPAWLHLFSTSAYACKLGVVYDTENARITPPWIALPTRDDAACCPNCTYSYFLRRVVYYKHKSGSSFLPISTYVLVFFFLLPCLISSHDLSSVPSYKIYVISRALKITL
jgi:hypothetical protein